MDSEIPLGEPFQFSEENVERLKQKYSIEMRDEPDHPIKNFLRLVYSAVIEKSTDRRMEISYELSKLLTQPHGVIDLFLSLIDFDASSQIVTTHNQRYMAVATLITRLPKCCLPYEKYCENISRQLMPLTFCKEPSYRSLACMIMKAMATSPRSEGLDIDQTILGPVIAALSDARVGLIEDTDLKPIDAIAILSNLSQVYYPIHGYVKVFPSLFYALVHWNDGLNLVVKRDELKLLILRVLDGMKPGAACCLLDSTLLHHEDISRFWRERLSQDNNIVNLTAETRVEAVPNSEKIQTVMSLLENCNNEALVLEFFFHFQESMWTAKDDEGKRLSVSLIEPLLEQTINEDSSNMNLFNTILKNSSKSVDLISRTLLNYLTLIRTSNESSSHKKIESKVFERSISSCINILEVILATNKHNVEPETWDSLKNILEELHQSLTKQNFANRDVFKSLDSLLTRIRVDLSEEYIDTAVIREKSENEFKVLVKDLNDKIVPVRVHALVKFRQLVIANDEYIKSRMSDLYAMVESFLFDSEPYVFLACINLIAELAVRDTQSVLDHLKEIYLNTQLDIQVRINVGEVMVRLLKQLNETTPLYAPQVFSILFEGSTDADELMRISSLVNIGEVCRHLGHSLAKYLLQILGLVEDILETATIDVKCAAIDLLRTTLSGLDRSNVEPIERELRSVYHLLKRSRSRSLDDKLDYQLDLTLDEIGRLAREFFSSPDLIEVALNQANHPGVSCPKGFVKLK